MPEQTTPNSSVLKDATKPVAAQPTSSQSTSTSPTSNNSLPEVRNPDFRFKHYIRVKIGGDSTGTLPTTAPAQSQEEKTDQLLSQVGQLLKASKDLTSKQETQGSAKLSDAKTSTNSNTLKDAQLLNQVGQLLKASKELNSKSDAVAPNALDKKASLDDMPRELIFDSRDGHFIGRAEIRSSTSQHSTVKFCLVDPEDKYREILSKLKNVEVVLGFVEGYERNIFVGEIRDLGRKLPNGTLVIAIDPTASKMQATTSGATVTATPVATTTSSTPATTTPSTSASSSAATTPTASKSSTAATPSTSTSSSAATTPTASKSSTAATTSTSTSSTPAPSAATPQTQTSGDLVRLINSTPQQKPLSKIFTESVDKDLGTLKFSDRTTNQKINQLGKIQIQQTLMAAATQEAALKGNTIAVRGNTVEEVSPGNAPSSGVVLDYIVNRDAFIGHPTVTRRSPVQLQGGGGYLVRGWNPLTKQVTEGVAYTQAPVTQHPTGVIQAPEWGAIKLADPIIPGSPYTWGDATKNGARVPSSKEIMGGIIRICQVITELTTKVGQKKFTICSWYRDPASNSGAGGKKNSRHLYGDAIDYYFSGSEYNKLFKQLWDTWPGGVAQGDGFTHVDDRHTQGKDRARWHY